jgi:hypothetical protein
MGNMQAQAMAATDTSIEVQIGWHLSSNHYPPVPSMMVPVCIDAIDAYNEGEYDREIALPGGIEYKGHPEAPAHAIIDQHHLHAWCVEED